MRNKFADVIYKIGKKDNRICAIVADISPAGSMINFREEFPDRFINCGVAEQSMIGIAAGLALKGMRPFCYTIATFSIYRPFEMIRVDLCYQSATRAVHCERSRRFPSNHITSALHD